MRARQLQGSAQAHIVMGFDIPALPDDPVDQDAEPTMTAPAEDRPDGGTQDPRGDSPDVADADGEG